MAGARHRNRHSTSPVRGITSFVGVLLLIVGGGVGAFVLLRDDGAGADCTGTVTLAVTVSPSLAGAVGEAAIAYQDGRPSADGRCVTVRVNAAAAPDVVEDMRDGWTDPDAGEVPDVWIPDSLRWLTLARITEPARRMLPEAGTTIATSPIVIASPRPMADELGWPQRQLTWGDLRASKADEEYWTSRGRPEWGPFTVGLADPRTSAAGLIALVNVVASALGMPAAALTENMFAGDLETKGALLDFERDTEVVAANEADLVTALRGAGADEWDQLSAIPASESLVYQFNRGIGIGVSMGDGPDTPLAASYPTDGLVVDEVPYIPLNRSPEDPAKAEAAQGLLAMLLADAGRGALRGSGFRSPERENPTFTTDLGVVVELRNEPRQNVDAGVLVTLQTTFARIHQRGNTLAVFDTSGSMKEEVPGGRGRNRLQVAVDAAKTTVPLFADESNIGLWHFSTDLDGDKDYVELVPIGSMSEPVNGTPRAEILRDALDELEPRGDTGLYDTTLAAFRLMNSSYVPGRPNQVVLLTDGKNDDPGSIELDELVTILRQEYDPQRPVQIITIGYGVDTDPAALRRISEATGARTYPALDPNTIFEVLVNALTETPG